MRHPLRRDSVTTVRVRRWFVGRGLLRCSLDVFFRIEVRIIDCLL
jgi:hypothetical protein